MQEVAEKGASVVFDELSLRVVGKLWLDVKQDSPSGLFFVYFIYF